MKTPYKRFAVIAIILVAAILLGVAVDLVWDKIDRNTHPDDHLQYVRKYAYEYNISEVVIFAVIKVESDFDTNAESVAGARGLMQMLPSTYYWLATKIGDSNPDEKLLFDPETNIRYGTYYLQYLYSRFGTWEKAIIAYNWGEGNFSEFLDEEGYASGDYDSIPVKETRNYIKKVMHHWKKYEELY